MPTNLFCRTKPFAYPGGTRCICWLKITFDTLFELPHVEAKTSVYYHLIRTYFRVTVARPLTDAQSLSIIQFDPRVRVRYGIRAEQEE